MFYSILDFGAVPGQVCTQAIQNAIDEADRHHGTVVVPAGEFVSGTLNLKSASLHIEKGGVLKGSGDFADYPFYGYLHTEMGEVHSLLYSRGGTGIVISGEGVIDLNGRAFYHEDRPDIPETSVPMTQEQIDECTRTYDVRPNQPICFIDCVRVTVRDVTIVDAPCWSMAFLFCTDVRVTDLTVDNPMTRPNSDGMHFCCCSTVSVRGCHISAGDDCVAITGITDWNRPCEKVTVSDCVFRSASKAISIGYMHSIVRDVVISNCVITESNRALVIMASTGTGLVENVLLSNLRLDTRIYAGNWWGNGEPLCFMATPHGYDHYLGPVPAKRYAASIRNIRCENLTMSGENAIGIVGEDGAVENVDLRHFTFQPKHSANLPLRGRIIDLAPGEQTAVFPDDGEVYWLYLRDAKNVKIADYRLGELDGRQPKAYVASCENCELIP